MKKIFLRRILPVVLCALMVIPTFALVALANSSLTATPGDRTIVGTERANWAPNGQGYHTSAWNYDRHSKYLNNGTYAHSYQYWQPSDPARPNGNGVDPTKQHVGFSFIDGYYLLEEIVIYANSYDKGYNNIKYTVQALILGEWVEVGFGYQDDGVESDHGGSVTKLAIELSHYRCGKCDAPVGKTWDKCKVDTCGATKDQFVAVQLYQCKDCHASSPKDATQCVSCGAGTDKLELKYDINTNNVRIWCSEYGSYAIRYGEYANQPPTWHDWWLTPCMQEVELWGYTGYRPEFDVPMNAYLVTNAALSGMIGADSSSRYPGQAGDDDMSTSWRAKSKGAQNIWAEFDQAYTIDNVGINIGGLKDAEANMELTYNIKILTEGTIKDGTWQTVVTGAKATTQRELTDTIIHDLGKPTLALGMMVEITDVKNSAGQSDRAVITELWAEISEGKKCIFLADYITTSKQLSTATGNLACYGKAYASSNFTYAGISNVSSIIDGNVGYADDAWIAETYILGTYAGVELRESHKITKVVLYFADVLAGENGEHVFAFDVQVKDKDGKFVTVAQATSYDAEKKSYISSVQLAEAVETDDVRIVFTSDAQTFPYLKEIEVFEGDFVYSSYDGYSLDISRTKGGPAATSKFGDRTVMARGKYFGSTTPIEYFNVALEHDVLIDWLG